MAFAATLSTAEPRAVGVGPKKFQFYTFTAASGDTSGTITAVGIIDRIDHVYLDGGLSLTAAPTFAANVVTLAFNDPLANAFGTALIIGV